MERTGMGAEAKYNDYSAGMKRIPEEGLREYIDNPDNYYDPAILAAIWELERRRGLRTDEANLESLILSRITSTVENISEIAPDPAFPLKEKLPSLYSMQSIYVFSVLFSVIGGGILMAINFNRTRNRSEIPKVLGFSVIYTLLAVLLLTYTGNPSPFLSVFVNLLGSFLIGEIFWKRVFGQGFQFVYQKIWSALLIGFTLTAPLVWYALKTGLMDNMMP